MHLFIRSENKSMFIKAEKGHFLTKDPAFYKAVFKMLIIVALQNVVSYSVNMIDNVMLGNYSQDALSGAATVNQVFFMVDQFALGIGNSVVVLTSQYWGENKVSPIRRLTGIALRLGIICSVIIIALCHFAPDMVLHIFTNDAAIIAEAKQYLIIMEWTFIMFIISNILMCVLRSVGTVRISFIISCISLVINAVGNYAFIYGNLGAPKMGIQGAALSTLIARIVELGVIIFFVIKIDKKLHLFKKELFMSDKVLRKDFRKVAIPTMLAQLLWGVSVPFQTAILGHLSSNAIAANSIATTFYQYLKVVVLAMASTCAVTIGNSIGHGDRRRVESDGRSLCVICLCLGIVLGLALIALRNPLLSLYNLNDETLSLARHLIVMMGFIMMTMAYQQPASFGIIMGAGNGQFTAKLNLISVWCIVIPLSLCAAFWWNFPVELVVLCVQSDQIFKCVPIFIYFRSYRWIRKVTRDEEPA